MNDSLGDRMKAYEDAYRIKLPRRTNVMIRVDGKAFHTYTKNCKKPFDDNLMGAMDDTMIALCEKIQGAKIGYVQSDEISIWATDYDRIETSAWFDNNLQKMVSISASVATAKFNSVRKKQRVFNQEIKDIDANFDSRVWIIPELAEVANYFLWRSQDASRNSVQMYARSFFSHGGLEGKSIQDIHEMLYAKGVNWNNLEPKYKRGRLALKKETGWEICDLTGWDFAYWMGIINQNKPKNETSAPNSSN